MPSAFAQTAQSEKPAQPATDAQPAATDASRPADDELIVLSPFTVSTHTEGYQAVDTLGGARVKTSLKDTASSLSVVTKSMMNDFGMTNAQDMLLYTTNTEIAGLGGNFSGMSSRGAGVSGTAEAGRLLNPGSINRSRGLTAMDNTRNYFLSEIPWDAYNVSRSDVSRGPNSFLFGVGSPSGISNYSTNEAVFKDQGDVQFRVGSFSSHRESIDYNKVLIPKQLAVRVDFVNDDTQYQQKPAFSHTKRLYGAVTYEPEMFAKESSRLKLTANAEIGNVRSNNPRTLPPVDMITGYYTGGIEKGGYDPFIYNTGQRLTGISSVPGLNPWVNGAHYHYAWPGPAATYWYEATTGKQVMAMTTLNGSNNGNAALGSSLPQASPLYISGFSNFARTMDNRFPNSFPGAFAGTVTYNDKSLSDTSIFDFYNKLIDGPNKREWQNWKSFNVTAEETMFDGRFTIQGIVDRQDFDQGQVGIYGYTMPWISVDMNSYQIIYPSWLPGMAVANPNVGRPITAGDFASADSSSHVVRNNYQLTANADLRASDIMDEGPLAKIFGRHSITGLFGQYNTDIETRAWNGAATDAAFAARMGDPTGSISSYRGVQWVSYLGNSLRNTSSASGQNFSNLASPIQPRSGVIRHFDNTWAPPAGVNASDPWVNPNPYGTGTNTQEANPANYRGWVNIPVNVLNWENDIDQLYTSGSRTEQKLKSMAFMYQGYLFDDMVIPSFGWRRDKISQRASNAPLELNTNVASMNYAITGVPDEVTTTSTSAGIVLHLPKSLRGKLPLGSDVSLYYFRGNNQTPKVRYGFDANRLPSEEGQTDDVSVRLDTLNGRLSVRLTYFKTVDKNGAAGSGAADPLGNNGYYLYLLPAWGAADAAMSGMALTGTMPYSDGGFTNNTGNVATQAAAVADFQANFAKFFPQSFFDAYGLGVNVNAITSGNFANVYNNPAQVAYPWNIANTGSGKINGGYPIITQDITSKGYELEVNMRPTDNWDITFNASKVSAVQTALGKSTVDFIEKEYQFFKGPAGQLPLWGYWGGTGDGASTLYAYFMQNIYSAYLVQKSQNNAEQPELSEWNLKGLAKYSFRKGALKGLEIGGGVRWASEPILGYGVSQVRDPEGNLIWLQDVNKPIRGSVDQHFDLWAGYQRALSDRVTWRIQLNLKNVGEKPHLRAISVLPDGTSAQKRIMEGQTFQITNKFMF